MAADAAASTSASLSLSLSGVDASEERARERADARGTETAVTFILPDGSTVSHSFGQGQEIGALKLWLVEESCFDPATLVLKFDGKALIDMLSLADVAGLAGAVTADVNVEGTVDEERKAAAASAGAASAEAASAMDEDDE